MSWDGAQVRFRTRSPIAAMIKQNRLDPTIGFFWGVVVAHVLFWTFLTAKTQPNVPATTLELLSSGRHLAWGYENQPPMAVWISSMVSAISNSRIWPLYFIAQICGMVSVWSAWTLARKFLHPWTALCGAVVLLGGYSCTIAAAELSSAHLASAFWSLSILAFHEALTEEKRRYWVATGFLLGLGFLTSYGTLLLLLTMFMFTLWDDRARRCWDSSWPFLAGMLMFLVMLPHILWLGRHDFITVQSRLASAETVFHHLEQPLSYLGTQLLCLIPVLVLLTPLVAWFSFEEPATQQDDPRDFARQYLLWMTCLPPIVIFGLSLMAGPSSSLFAGVTNWTYLGIAILLWGHLTETRISWRRTILRIGGSVGIFAATLIVLNVMWPQLTGFPSNTRFPGKQLAKKVAKVWEESRNTGTIPVLVGSEQLVKNAAWNAKASSEILTYEDMVANTSTSQKLIQELVQKGGVLIYDLDAKNRTEVEKLGTLIGNLRLLPDETFSWNGLHSVKPVRVGLAVIHPANSIRPLLTEQNPEANDPTLNQSTIPILPTSYPEAIVTRPSPLTNSPSTNNSSSGSSIPSIEQPLSPVHQFPVGGTNSNAVQTPQGGVRDNIEFNPRTPISDTGWGSVNQNPRFNSGTSTVPPQDRKPAINSNTSQPNFPGTSDPHDQFEVPVPIPSGGNQQLGPPITHQPNLPNPQGDSNQSTTSTPSSNSGGFDLLNFLNAPRPNSPASQSSGNNSQMQDSGNALTESLEDLMRRYVPEQSPEGSTIVPNSGSNSSRGTGPTGTPNGSGQLPPPQLDRHEFENTNNQNVPDRGLPQQPARQTPPIDLFKDLEIPSPTKSQVSPSAQPSRAPSMPDFNITPNAEDTSGLSEN